MPHYLKFINLANVLEEEFIRSHAIDRRGLKLLEAISIQHSLNQSLMTTDVMALSQFGSPAAIHRSLWLLRDKGLALVFHKGKDRRTKYLCTSEIVKQYYAQLGVALITASEVT
jgi:hypothetical protein